MPRSNTTLRIEDEVDEYLDKKMKEWDTTRSEIVNRAIKVYAAKLASGQWQDSKFSDEYDDVIEDV